MSEIRIGVDVGGSGVKTALVDVSRGVLAGKRLRLPTPKPATPEAVVAAVAEVVGMLDRPEGRVGVGFPAVIRDGIVHTANNIDPAWIGVDAHRLISAALDTDVVVVNDADAAGIAEAAFGEAEGIPGVVLVVTFGTGIGSALLVDGRLAPNLELGQIELDGHLPAESHFSAKARTEEDLGWEEWAARANRYLLHVTRVFSPTRIVVGGGVTKRWEEFAGLLDPELAVVPAALRNNAGIVGAAVLAATG